MKKYSIIGALLIALGAVAVIFMTEGSVEDKLKEGMEDLAASMVPEAREEYGIEVDDFYVCTERIRPNENLSTILSRYDLPYEVIHEVADKSKNVFDVRNLRVGKSYCIMRSTDSTEQVRYFIYEQDPVNYVVYDFSDTIDVYKGRKPTYTRSRQGSGIINSSLWQTLTENDLDPNMAVRLSEIFAWSIDFYRIHKGDRFKILFDETYVEGERIGVGEIAGVWFQHQGRDYYGYKYAIDDTTTDYFDENGNSLRKAFLKAPLEFRRISSRFNRRRFHPVLKRRRPHLGTDYAAPTGTPVWSIGDGTVVKRAYNRGAGNHIEIRHNGTYSTRYLHLSKFAAGLTQGGRVKQGEIIGYVGTTGLSTGPHLHFEMIKNGGHVDAMQEDIPPGDPVPEECRPSFEQIRDQLTRQLNVIPISEGAPQGTEEDS